MKRFLSLVLALAFALSMAAVASAEEERMTIVWIGYSQSPEPDQERELYLEERFNVNLEFPAIDAFDEEQFNMWLSGGGEFDVLNLSLGTNQFNTCVEQGLDADFRHCNLHSLNLCLRSSPLPQPFSVATRGEKVAQACEI